MRALLVGLAGTMVLALTGARAADVVERNVTEGSTTYRGTVADIDPSASTIILKSDTATAPTRYTFTKNTTFVDDAGKVVTPESTRGNLVTIYTTREGDSTMVDKVVTSRPHAGSVIEQRETTEERREVR